MACCSYLIEVDAVVVETRVVDGPTTVADVQIVTVVHDANVVAVHSVVVDVIAVAAIAIESVEKGCYS